MNASHGGTPYAHGGPVPGAYTPRPYPAYVHGGPGGPPPPMAPPGLPHTPQLPAARPDQAFAPPDGVAWARVSRRFTWHRRLSVLSGAVPVAMVGGLLAGRGGGAAGALCWVFAVAAATGLVWWMAELSYRSWGFAERTDDLLLTSGVFARRLVVVPYGRMQFVDVTAGPLEQLLGVATVRLHTAAAATDARIPCLPAADAAHLCDRLAQRGEARTMGL